LPGVGLPAAVVGTPFSDLPVPGDKPQFSPLFFTFMVTDDMKNYEEIFQWINSIGFSDSYETFSSYDNKDKFQQLGEQDVKVQILSAKGNPVRTITFYDAIPVSLSGTELTTQSSGVQYIQATVSMVYSRFDFTD
jgi:hypothetical protein